MPRTDEQANPIPPSPDRLRFAACVIVAYCAACLPLLALRHFDPSVFVVAGSRYVAAGQTHPALRVKPHSNGYDGQFYYRLAINPISTAPRLDGIMFDHPAKRTTRILYPLLAWLASAGQPGLTAWAMLGVNLAALGAIAWLATGLAARLRLPAAVPLAIVAWPGFIVTLLHDTTEIVAAALLLAALSAWFARRPARFAGLACCAVLARETTLAALVGLLGLSAAGAWRAGCRTPTLAWLLACAAPVLLFAIWSEALALALDASSQAPTISHDLGWPFLGAATILYDCLTGARSWAAAWFKNDVERAYVLISAIPLLTFCVLVAARLRTVCRQPAAAQLPASQLPASQLAASWSGTAALMSLLSATGPWVDPIAYLRAFTECFVVGCLLLGAGSPASRTRLLARATLAQAGLAWAFCMIKLR